MMNILESQSLTSCTAACYLTLSATQDCYICIAVWPGNTCLFFGRCT